VEMRSGIIATAAIVVAAFTQFQPAAWANTITPLSFSCSATASDGEGVSQSSCNPDTTAEAVWPPSDLLSSVVSGEARASAAPSTTTVSAYASLDQSNNPYSFGLGYASASSSLTYYLEVSPLAPGGIRGQVNVYLAGMMTIAGQGTASATITISDPLGNVLYQINTATSDNYSGTLDLLVGQQYQVVMTADAFVQQTTDTLLASADPTFTLDPAYDSEAELIFSPGIGSAPLPASLPLFASGLGALGFLGWRRKRRAEAA
jgi:hypothetical protein